MKRHHIKSSLLEAAFSRGDRNLNKVLLHAWNGGARFDSWTDLFSFRPWEEAFEGEQVDYHVYLSPLEREARLPWDHIESGIKKSHLLKEMDKAMKEEVTSSCWERSCTECQGCIFNSLLDRKFSDKIRIPSVSYSFLGKKTEKVFRYRAFYSKLRLARFFSHIDLNNILRRALRRAGISVSFSEGFHPKMLISHPSALPLGMEGKVECFEFKSQYLFGEHEFKNRMNAFLPEGIRISGLSRIEPLKPALNAEIEELVYSVDLRNHEIKEAVRTSCRANHFISRKYFQMVENLVEDFLSKSQNGVIKDFLIDRKKGRLILNILHSQERNISAQKIVEKIFQMKNPAFIMAREKILFKKS